MPALLQDQTSHAQMLSSRLDEPGAQSGDPWRKVVKRRVDGNVVGL